MIELVDAARHWAADQLTAGRIPAQVDLDALAEAVPPKEAVTWGIQCAAALSAEVARAGQRHQTNALVVFPLGFSSQLMLSAPALSTLADGAWDYGPGKQVPGLYLLSRALLGEYEAAEEYKSPVDDKVVPRGFAAYYRCWRSADDAKKGWEFARAIYVVSVVDEVSSPWLRSSA